MKTVIISKERLEKLKRGENAETNRLRKKIKILQKEINRLKNMGIMEHLFGVKYKWGKKWTQK